jgi:FkbM family methyltransferase
MNRSDVALDVKISVAEVLTSSLMGAVIGAATRNKIPHHGLRFDVNDQVFTPRVRAALFWRLYESAEIRMIRRHLGVATTVVELGASLGITSAHIASRLVRGSRLLCVEADSRLADGLGHRLAPHSSHIMLEIENLAITCASGPVDFALAGSNLDGRLTDGAAAHAASVEGATLRTLLDNRRIGEFDLVCDIEGAEASFLLGDPGALEGCRRAVFELHDTTFAGRAVTADELLESACDFGFRVIERHGVVVALDRGH